MQNKFVLLGTIAMTLTVARPSLSADVCAAAGGMEPAGHSITGTVVETMNASRYTYVQVDTGTEKIWAAGPMATVKVGDGVSLGVGQPNKNFYSPTLKRKFDALYFVDAIAPLGSACPAGATGTLALPPGHPAIQATDTKASTNAAAEAIQKPDGGKTVAEIWDAKASLSGKPVVIRGKVAKFTPNILGMNWLHLRDGTGSDGRNDLTVTTKSVVTVGQIVTARGLLSTSKDFGAGYKYDVIIEDATVTVP